jgi:hypothetical protein
LARGVKLTTRSIADRPTKRRLGLESDRNHARNVAGVLSGFGRGRVCAWSASAVQQVWAVALVASRMPTCE